jgi:soluble lytic murein transglycosylase-like protein
VISARPDRLRLLLTVFSFSVISPAVFALEQVDLRTGDSIRCAHHELIDAAHVRLFYASTNPGGDENYQDLPVSMITGFQRLPDPLPAPPAAAPAEAAPAAQSADAADIPTLLASAGAQRNIDVDLLASIVKAESGGRVHAVSRAGARGLMQLMPATAQDLGVQDAFQPGQNIAGGTQYLNTLLDRYCPHNDKHGLDLALAAYNAGPAAVDHYHGIPPYPETRNYVARVEDEFNRRKRAAQRPQAARTQAVTVASR